MQIEWNNFSVHFILKSFCSNKIINTITFLNSIIFKNRFIENYAYHFRIKKYVLNIFQERTKEKKLNAKKISGGKSPVEWTLRYIKFFSKTLKIYGCELKMWTKIFSRFYTYTLVFQQLFCLQVFYRPVFTQDLNSTKTQSKFCDIDVSIFVEERSAITVPTNVR